MNANERSDLEIEVFVNHGWESLQFFEQIESRNTYDCYVKMENRGNSIWQGSIMITNGDRFVGLFTNITVSLYIQRSSQYGGDARILAGANERERETYISPDPFTSLSRYP